MPTDKASIFKRLGNEFKKMIKVISPGKVIKSIIWGENLLLIMRNLLQTLQRVQMEQGADSQDKAQASAATPGSTSAQTTEANEFGNRDSAAGANQQANQAEDQNSDDASESHFNTQHFSFIRELFNIALN